MIQTDVAFGKFIGHSRTLITSKGISARMVKYPIKKAGAWFICDDCAVMTKDGEPIFGMKKLR